MRNGNSGRRDSSLSFHCSVRAASTVLMQRSTWRTKDDHTAEKIAGLEDLAAKVQARVDEFKAQPALKEELAHALRLKIAALDEFKGEHDEQSDAIRAQIKTLRAELDGLGPGYATGAATSKTSKKRA